MMHTYVIEGQFYFDDVSHLARVIILDNCCLPVWLVRTKGAFINYVYKEGEVVVNCKLYYTYRSYVVKVQMRGVKKSEKVQT